ncbi:hypothetical protein PPL_05881 [Heterostelium album PN500]|uniref:Cyanocobalamin reductase (cyanide-eliminating) n=1 Tax=Heterostelium pallidum (strain ATCC 26659 / Pp 5 / PN500) TaxID=670386 RepID=D3BBL2_HETP5|nr:hypothetical protein PPL_05881 [Heterostelium album PN500]EFA81045.1 hypothetical protein PPL_05881 [Heterostelium album PN500]|eukprot:XP_020433163.1 hypothetical protein PPL_05881 [Heterostelium album PN500]
METLVKSLQDQFAKHGFNIVEPFMVNDYNNACKYKLNNLGNENAMGLIVGCNKDFWSYFTKYMESLDSIPKDPMNSFCFATIEHVLATNEEAQKHHYDVRYDWNSVQSGKYAHMQTAGHFAGVAYYDRDVMWSIHPVYGLWKWCVGPTSPSTKVGATWRHASKFGESCPLGRDKYKYEGDMFDFFYPIARTSRSVLESIMQNKLNKSTTTTTDSTSSICCSNPTTTA